MYADLMRLGYVERGIAVLQCCVEFAILTPDTIRSDKGNKDRWVNEFRAFFKSNAPRVGEQVYCSSYAVVLSNGVW